MNRGERCKSLMNYNLNFVVSEAEKCDHTNESGPILQC